jgi:hypothetical protein
MESSTSSKPLELTAAKYRFFLKHINSHPTILTPCSSRRLDENSILADITSSIVNRYIIAAMRNPSDGVVFLFYPSAALSIPFE